MKIPFFSFEQMHSSIRDEMTVAFTRFYDSNWYVLGNEVQAFEQEYARYSGCTYCVGVANGLDALHIALLALGIGKGDEVIVPSNTYIATWLAVSYTGATLVPVEPNPATYNLDPDRLEAAITERTKVIMPVHLYGQPCEMDKIMQLAKNQGIYVVEDNAQSQGATWMGKKTGTFGDLNGVSFYPGKNLGALGDAGALTTNKEDLAQEARTIRNYGSEKKYYNKRIGINSRLDELQAAILRLKLSKLDEWNAERKKIASWYLERLQGTSNLQLPTVAEGAESVWHQFVVLTAQRDQVINQLGEKGVGTLIHYPVPPHLQQAYQSLGFGKGDFPIAETISSRALSLPMYPGLKEEEIEYICDNIKRFVS